MIGQLTSGIVYIYICILSVNLTWKLVQTTIKNYSSHQHKVVRWQYNSHVFVLNLARWHWTL